MLVDTPRLIKVLIALRGSGGGSCTFVLYVLFCYMHYAIAIME